MLRTYALALLVLSSIACVDSSLEDTTPAARLETGGEGTVSLEWAIFVGEDLNNCIDAGADSVVLVLSKGEREITQVMGCLSGLAETTAIDSGDYEVAVRLVDYEGTTLDEVELGTLTIQPNRTTALGLVDFVLVERDPVRRDNRD